MQYLGAKLTSILGSRWFFRAALAFFVFEALWVALSSYYPMAFDEDFHFGIIKLYAEGWAPWLSSDTGSSGVYGAVVRDPSFLFHWLMSFPYRLVTLFTDSQAAAVIFLRLINIGMFTAGLLMSYRLLRSVGTSAAFSNTALALFVLIPIVPLVAGQINYDNLLMVLTAGLLLLALGLYRGFRERRFDFRLAALFVIVCAFGAITKYAFLPIAVATAVFVIGAAWVLLGGPGRMLPALRKSYRSVRPGVKVGLLVLLAVGLGLCLQRYGGNIVRYGTPLPDCADVLSVEQCKKYGPWGRDYGYAQQKGDVDANPLHYTDDWLKGMHKRLFFMINGPHHHYYQNYPPMPVLGWTAVVLAVIGVLAIAAYGWRAIRRNPLFGLLLFVSLFYIAVVWFDNYMNYLATGRVVAVNGRYLLPVLLPLAAVVAAGLHLALRPVPRIKPFIATAAILLFLQGGGVVSFILRSDDAWYWENDVVVEMNHAAKKVLDPLVYEGRL